MRSAAIVELDLDLGLNHPCVGFGHAYPGQALSLMETEQIGAAHFLLFLAEKKALSVLGYTSGVEVVKGMLVSVAMLVKYDTQGRGCGEGGRG